MAPATFNTVNKWAAGISDTLALGILCEAYGMNIPTAVLPYVNSAQAAHPAYLQSLERLREMGVLVGSYVPIPPRERGARYLQAAPDDGMHALRHAYASVLLDAGESIKTLSEYLGHSDPGFTLRTYTHLLPSSETRTRRAIDDAFTEEPEETAETEGPGREGTSAPPSKPMCPQCALAA